MSDSTANNIAGHGHGHDEHHDDGRVHVHVASTGFYWGIFAALICLTVLTVAVSYVDLGRANTVVAILVASMKMTLVAAFFMHLTHDKTFHSILFVSSFVFLGIFFALTYEDEDSRTEFDEDQGAHVLPGSGAPAPGGIPAAENKPVGGGAGHGEHPSGEQGAAAGKPAH